MKGYLKTLSFAGTICYYIALAIFFLLYFPVFLVVFIFITPFDRKRVVMHYVSKIFCLVIIRLCPFWKVEVSGLEKFDPNQTYIIASNHQSMMDIPLLGHVIPSVFRYISKKEVCRIPIIGWVIRLRGDITIDRGGAKSAKSMISKSKKLTSQGISIMIFPEGTRTKTGRVDKFKEGAFLVAKMNSLPIIPIVIEGTWEANNYFGAFLKMPTTFKLTILDPIPEEEVSKMRIKDLSAHVQDIILTTHKEIEPQLYVGKEDFEITHPAE